MHFSKFSALEEKQNQVWLEVLTLLEKGLQKIGSGVVEPQGPRQHQSALAMLQQNSKVKIYYNKIMGGQV